MFTIGLLVVAVASCGGGDAPEPTRDTPRYSLTQVRAKARAEKLVCGTSWTYKGEGIWEGCNGGYLSTFDERTGIMSGQRFK